MKKKEDQTVEVEEMNLIERMQAPTPKFFKVVRTVGLAIAAVGGTLLAAPVAIPAGIAAAAGYIALAGGVLTAVSQATVDTSTDAKPSAIEQTQMVSARKRKKPQSARNTKRKKNETA
ncbi:MAG: hypothetical protein FWG54_06060 [Bacteroidetes bacterium]|nr:hypothetical protein [Bacteroidota bacterium]